MRRSCCTARAMSPLDAAQVAALKASASPVLAGQLLRLADPLPQRQRGVVVPVRLGRGGQPLGLPARPGPRRRTRRRCRGWPGSDGPARPRCRARWPAGPGRPAARRTGRAAGSAHRAAGRRRAPRGSARAGTCIPRRRRASAAGARRIPGPRPRSPARPGRTPPARMSSSTWRPATAAARSTCWAGGGQPLEPGQQQRGQPAGQHVRTAARGGAGGQQFLGVVRVPLGPGHDPVQRGRVQRAVRQRGQVIRHVRVAERPELDRGHAGQPEQLRHHRAQRVPAVQVVGAVGDHHRDPFPVQHPADRKVTRSRVDRSAQCRSSRISSTGRVAASSASRPSTAPNSCCWASPGRLADHGWAGFPVRQQPAEHRPGGQRVGQRPGRGGAGHAFPQRVGERQVRDAVAQLGAPSGEHQEAPVGGPRRQLGDQARLADPGVPADQRVRRAAWPGVVEQAEQAGQFTVPAHQPFTRTAQHMFSITARRDPGPRNSPGVSGECRSAGECAILGA